MRPLRRLPAGVVLGVGCLIVAGCARRPAPAPPLSVATSDSLIAALDAIALPEGLSGTGRVALTVGDESYPVLDLRFAVSRHGTARAMLRPGVLPPVATLRADSSRWWLLLPRQQMAFESEPSGSGNANLPARLLWYALVPAALARELAHAEVTQHSQLWILRGRIDEKSAGIAAAEIWFDPTAGGIERVGFISSRGEDVARALYDEPLIQARENTRLLLLAPTFDAQIEITLATVEPGRVADSPAPPLSARWRRLPAAELGHYLDTLGMAGR